MKKHLLLLTALSLGMFACTDEVITSEDNGGNNVAQEEQSSATVLKTAKLASFNSSQNRVVMEPSTRADENPLTLIGTITNISEEGQITGFVKESRLLSATCVYYDQETETYYATYHMQGNNYYTKQENETGGFIETFKIINGEVVPGKFYTAADPSQLSFDFNHLYFDHIPNVSTVNAITGETLDYVGTYDIDDFKGHRVIAVGHKSEPSSKENGKPNTAAIIAELNFDGENATIDYATIYTGDKITEEGVVKNDGTLMPLGDEDAADANCVVRKYNHYYVATRKGVAVLKGSEADLFAPEVDVNGHNYFLRTPGSAKFLSQPTTTSYIDILYLTQDTPEEGLTAQTSSPANVVELALDTRDGKDCPINMTDAVNFDWNALTSPNKQRFANPFESIMPVDGKNVMFAGSNNTGAIYTCLGKNGLYVYNPTYDYKQDEIIKFSDKKDGTGSRPVNGLYVEDWDSYNGHHYTDGFIYVANGACLTILDAFTFEKVAEYSAHLTDENASANYVHVVRTNTETNEHVPDRIITVAYGQAGVKVFRFVPPTK